MRGTPKTNGACETSPETTALKFVETLGSLAGQEISGAREDFPLNRILELITLLLRFTKAELVAFTAVSLLCFSRERGGAR